MAADFLPPVVTTLDGNIDPLLRQLAKAEAAIKALGKTSFNVPVNVQLNEQSVASAMAKAKAQTKNGVTAPVKFEPDTGSLITTLATAEAVARANPIYVPVKFTVDSDGGAWADSRALTASAPLIALQRAAERLAITSGGSSYGPAFSVPTGGWNTSSGNIYAPRNPNYMYALGGREPLALTAGPGGGSYFRAPSYTNNFPSGRGGWLAGLTPWGIPMTGWHAMLLGAMGLGAGALGTLGGAAGLAGVWANGAASAATQARYIDQTISMTIPPGVPDYALARAFGLNVNPNGTWARASAVGNGQVLGFLGGATSLANRMMGGGGALSGEGLMIGGWLNRTMAGLDLRKGGSSWLKNFLGVTGYDAINVGRTFSDVGQLAGKLLAHSPGEIEWLTGGASHILGALNWILGPKDSIGGLNIGGGLLDTAMMYHVLTTISDWGGKGLGAMGLNVGKMSFLNLGQNLRGIGAGLAEKFGLGTVGGIVNAETGAVSEATGLAGALGNLGGPAMAGVAIAVTALGLLVYHLVNTKDKVQIQVAAINSSLQSMSLSQYVSAQHGLSSTALRGIGVAGNAVSAFNPAALASYGRAYATSSLGNSQSDVMTWANEFIKMGQGENRINQFGALLNSKLHLGSAAAAVALAGQAGITFSELTKGGNAKSIQAVLNYIRENSILNGKTGEALMNIGVGKTVNDSAWKDASQINSNWDAYIGAMTGGAQGLNSLYTALSGVPGFSPATALANSIKNPRGLIPTAAAIQSAGEPLLDFFRQAQSVGAISGKSLQSSFMQVAGSMIPLAGHSKTAQAMLVALANESGVNVKNFGQLKASVGSASKAEGNLTNSVSSTILAMTRLGPYASKVMQQIQTDTQQALSAIIAKSPQASNAFMGLASQIAQGSRTSKQAYGDMSVLIGYLASHGYSVSQIAGFFKQLGYNWNAIPNYAKKGLNVETNANAVAGSFNTLLGHWNAIPNSASKVLSVITNYVSSASPYQPPHPHGSHALGVRDKTMGQWSWVGEYGPEMAYLPPGSHVIPTHRTGQTLANMSNNNVNGGDIHNHIYIDGRELFNAMKSRTYQYNVNNGNRDDQGRVTGNLRPR